MKISELLRRRHIEDPRERMVSFRDFNPTMAQAVCRDWQTSEITAEGKRLGWQFSIKIYNTEWTLNVDQVRSRVWLSSQFDGVRVPVEKVRQVVYSIEPLNSSVSFIGHSEALQIKALGMRASLLSKDRKRTLAEIDLYRLSLQ